MQPYEEATEEIKRRQLRPRDVLGGIASTGIAAVGAMRSMSMIGQRVLPFLNKYIDKDLMIKGLSKINPKFKDFINKAEQEGYDLTEIKDFIKSDVDKKAENLSKLNLVEQHSPELDQFIKSEISKGRSPLQAGAIAQNNGKFKSIIDSIKKSSKGTWQQILESVYGAEGMAPSRSVEKSTEVENAQPRSELAQIMAGIREGMSKLGG